MSAPLQAVLLLIGGPFLDKFITGAWIQQYEYSVPAVVFLITSCSVAILVNASQYFCLGRFSAVTFQVLGHLKTVLVLVGGWTILREPCSIKQVAGCSLAVGGMVLYGYLASKARRPEQEPAKEGGLKDKLLPPSTGSAVPKQGSADV